MLVLVLVLVSKLMPVYRTLASAMARSVWAFLLAPKV